MFITWCCKNGKFSSPIFHSRNTSSDPSSKSDLEAAGGYFGVPIFSYNELAEATDNFHHDKELGERGFGTVYHGFPDCSPLMLLIFQLPHKELKAMLIQEYIQSCQLTDKRDVYSFGVVLIELISSMPDVHLSRHKHEINFTNLAINRIQKHAINDLIDPCLGFQSDEEVIKEDGNFSRRTGFSMSATT
ncbi:hypothetical protein EZV62_018654 [Acer yangbiense]|uniref:Serine-threonine/tyrosine-protein kinase catalytic domain-containing protein n=1 Tax=Acer yangbiense TaxID=1000413 RepID=A0A5C7HJZ7_9ROSI|nr:hypothetical protein EZV62_018654 [Acer yangbiense]